MQKLVESLELESSAASSKCATAEKARENAEKAAAEASAQLVTLQLELHSLRGAHSRALSDAEDFDQRVAAAIAGEPSWPDSLEFACQSWLLLHTWELPWHLKHGILLSPCRG